MDPCHNFRLFLHNLWCIFEKSYEQNWTAKGRKTTKFQRQCIDAFKKYPTMVLGISDHAIEGEEEPDDEEVDPVRAEFARMVDEIIRFSKSKYGKINTEEIDWSGKQNN